VRLSGISDSPTAGDRRRLLHLIAYSSDRERRFHAMVNGAWGGQLESEFLR
jgi:hypothetical protein